MTDCFAENGSPTINRYLHKSPCISDMADQFFINENLSTLWSVISTPILYGQTPISKDMRDSLGTEFTNMARSFDSEYKRSGHSLQQLNRMFVESCNQYLVPKYTQQLPYYQQPQKQMEPQQPVFADRRDDDVPKPDVVELSNQLAKQRGFDRPPSGGDIMSKLKRKEPELTDANNRRPSEQVEAVDDLPNAGIEGVYRRLGRLEDSQDKILQILSSIERLINPAAYINSRGHY